MSDDATQTTHSAYTVVARRYRPRTFGELIGQEHIAQALSKAIASGRVGHAYLFTGARGVGKTSTARIFAKALNTEALPEGSGDIAQAIDTGEDIDVIEIDGASNRGIEEIRQLRANVTVRPSRARFKIYIIDEVHMLTNQAFNALLKTLEEPPEHVKFIFCTTDPDKIPITVLSRCQRFDFVPVKFDAIQKRLKEIATAEGYEADDEALSLLARKAAGSMRDSQSLLEQVMSFSTDRITAQQVHDLLGTADEGRLLALVEAMRDRSALRALGVVDEATRGGADPGQLAEQLLNYLRDVMTAGIGGTPDLLRLANPIGHTQLKEIAQAWGIQTIVSAIQILDESLVRMRSSVSSTTLLEVALVQICQLQDLAYIPALLESIAQGGPLPPPGGSRPVPTASVATIATQSPTATSATKSPTSPAAEEKKNDSQQPENLIREPVAASSDALSNDPNAAQIALNPLNFGLSKAIEATPEPTSMADRLAPDVAIMHRSQEESEQVASRFDLPKQELANTIVPSNASSLALQEWKAAVATIDGILADYAGLAQSIEPLGSDQWTVYFPPGGQKTKDYCEYGDRRGQLQSALQNTLGRPIRLTFAVRPGQPPKPSETVIPQSNLRAAKIREVSENPLIKKIVETLGGEIVRVDGPIPQAVNRPLLTPERIVKS
jgi:DNA polymerase III subunit gamma/tau